MFELIEFIIRAMVALFLGIFRLLFSVMTPARGRRARRGRKKELHPVVLAIVLLLVIIGAIGAAVQSCSSSATPSTDGAVETTDPTTPAPTTTPAAAPLVSSRAAVTPQVVANLDDDPERDVKLLGCSWTSDSYTTKETVNVRVNNRTDTDEFYSVDVGISDAQGQIGTATAVAESVPPGGSVTTTGFTVSLGTVQSMRCQVTNVDRIPQASGGTGTSDLPHVHLPDIDVPHPDVDPFHIRLGHGHK